MPNHPHGAHTRRGLADVDESENWVQQYSVLLLKYWEAPWTHANHSKLNSSKHFEPTFKGSNALTWTTGAEANQLPLRLRSRRFVACAASHSNAQAKAHLELCFDITLHNAPNLKPQRTITMDALEIRVTPRGRAHMETHWVPFGSWLDEEVATWPAIPSRVASWRKANSKIFRFFDLPGELRNEIYKAVTGTYVWPHGGLNPVEPWGMQPWVRTFDFTPRHEKLDYTNIDAKTGQFSLDPLGRRPPSATALAIVGKRVKSEFEYLLWEHTFKHIQSPTALREMVFLMKDLNVIRYQSLRRISLGLPNIGFLKLVGLYVTGDGEMFTCSMKPVEALQSLKGLEHLHLHFQTGPPYRRGDWHWVSGDPWLLQTRWHDDAPCQKFIIDLILTFGLHYIRRIPNITMSGHIKNSTRSKWESIFEDERRGVEHDMTERMAELLLDPDKNA